MGGVVSGSAEPAAPGLAAAGADRPSRVGVARAGLACAWALAAASVATVLWQVGNGFDLTDEAYNLLAAAPPRSDDAFNGLSGQYTHVLWAAVQWDVGAARGVGLLLLLGSGAVLGVAAARLLNWRPGVVVAVAVAASTGFYSYGSRTPSYNLLATAGAVLTSAALLGLLAGGSARWGALAGGGLAVAAAGKASTVAVLAVVVVVVVVRLRRLRVLGWTAAVLAGATAVHVLVILPAADTVNLLRRSAAFLAVLDPVAYTPTGAVGVLARGLPLVALAALAGGAPLGLLPLAALRAPGHQRLAWLRALCILVPVTASVVALGLGLWSGVVERGSQLGGGVVPLTAAVALAVLVMHRSWPAPAPPGESRPQLAAAGILLAATAAVIAGSNLRVDALLESVTGLLGPACLLLAAALPRPARAAGLAAVAACLLGGSLVTSVQAHHNPKRAAALADSVVPVALGPAVVRLDPATAGSIRQLVAAASAAGWQRGMPLVDASYVPAVPLALGAQVPPVLLPTVPGWPPSAVCTAVQGLGPSWSGAWLVLPDDAPPDTAEQVAGALGRRFPRDYQAVATLRGAHLLAGVTLLRPRPGPPENPGCLGAATGA